MITLINPPSPWANDPAMNPQLGLCYVSAALKSGGYSVQGVDFGAIKADYTKTDYLLNQKLMKESDVFGIYCMSVQFHWVKQIVQFIKASNSKSKIFIGGPHATCCPDDCFSIGADYAVKGQGAFAINDVLSGAVGRLYETNLIPDRTIFDHYEYHRTINGERAFHIVTLRGCPYSCRYCDKESVGREVFYRPVECVMDEIDMLIENHHSRSFVIYDDIFTLKYDRLKIFCDEFAKRNLQWRCWSRTDLVDKPTLQIMKDSGLTSITFGVESGDATVLKRINKRAKVDDNYGALLLCQKLDIPVRCSLMFGNPGECKKSLLNTIDMIRFCTPDEWNLAVLKPMPGSAFWNFPEKFGLEFDKQAIIDSDYEILNRFEDNGIGNIICSIDSCPDDELKELLPWFVSELERVCPRKNIQDTIQEIKLN
jgi:anaerobic magnesium-protoporphyrin IX monomethyl ester cyclase